MKIRFNEETVTIIGVSFNGGEIEIKTSEYFDLYESMQTADAKSRIIEYLEERKDSKDEGDEDTQYFEMPIRNILKNEDIIELTARDVAYGMKYDTDDDLIYMSLCSNING